MSSMQRLRVLIALCLIPASLLTGIRDLPADEGKCLDEVCFEPRKEISGHPLELRGLGLMEYWAFDLYTAALYLPQQARTVEDVLADTPKSLILHYHRDIKKKQFIKAASKNLEKKPVDLTSIQERLDRLNEAYEDVEKGSRYELRYEPGKGTSLIFNGELKTVIPGQDFANAYFSIWLGQESINNKVRDKLIGARS